MQKFAKSHIDQMIQLPIATFQFQVYSYFKRKIYLKYFSTKNDHN